MAIGIGVTFVNWVWALRRGALAGRDPWHADTLEWATTSPPPEYDFETIPEVRSLHPVWDQPELQAGHQTPEQGGRPLASGHQVLSTSLLDATPEAVVTLPKDSLWPFAVAVALMAFFYGALVRIPAFAALGGAATVITFLGWMWPRGSTQET
jgi:cytochrome c oxidase subunit 1/cytochrome c oxidase subunit I+III